MLECIWLDNNETLKSLFLHFDRWHSFGPVPIGQLGSLDLQNKALTDGADLVAHGVADELVGRVIHDENLIHAELMAGWDWLRGLGMRAALKTNALPPKVHQSLGRTVREGHLVFPSGGGGDH